MKKVMTMAVAIAFISTAVPAAAYEAGDWILRVGLTTVDPDTESDDIALNGELTAEADVDDDTQLGIIPAYMITQNWGVELLAATPFEHDIEAKGKGAISGTTVDAGSTKHLPPTLMLQWYPRGDQEGWQPYIGLGVNYTNFFDEDTDSDLIATLDAVNEGVDIDDADLDLDDSVGFAAQAGVDIPFSERFSFNIGVWYLDIETDAELTVKSGGASVGTVKFDVDIDPWVYNIGIAYRF